ncbi:MAG: polysaccharide pyruvyl transferase family protein [Methanosarcinales archaeon]|nr:polysaccharide pyruvyl transferase family protein [Methanosarcinales archaeon]
MKMIIIDEFNSLNNGEMARVISAIEGIKNYIPNVNFTIFSSDPEIDKERYKKFDIKVIKRPWYLQSKIFIISLILSMLLAFITIINCLFSRFFKKGKFQQYDIFIHLLGDVFNDYGIIPLFYHLFHISIGLIIGKPVIIYGESIGPFKNHQLKFLTKVVLNRVSLILVREEISFKYLSEMGVNKSKIRLTNDPAFALIPASQERIEIILSQENIKKGNKPFIGISPVQGIRPDIFPQIIGFEKKYEEYIEFIANITDYIQEKLDANIVFVPHVLRHDDDDRIICEKIMQKIENKKNVVILKGMYTADELKGIISQFDIFLGSRMHATIASTSMYVPTIALAHSHKFIGIIGGILDQNDFVIDLRKSNTEDLLNETKSKIDYSWKNRDIIREKLYESMKKAREKAFLNGKYVKELCESINQ